MLVELRWPSIATTAGTAKSVKHLPEPLSRRNRNRVLKLSSSYRNPMVKHEPELHIHVGKQIDKHKSDPRARRPPA
jgi:hypothetical protein